MKNKINLELNQKGWVIVKKFLKDESIKKFTEICFPLANNLEKEYGTSKKKDLVYCSFDSSYTRKIIQEIFRILLPKIYLREKNLNNHLLNT